MNTVRLFKSGDQMAVSTTAKTEEEFHTDFCQVLSDLIDSGVHASDWNFQLQYWLKSYAEICCKLRGYRSNVTEERIIMSGSLGVTALSEVTPLDLRERARAAAKAAGEAARRDAVSIPTEPAKR